MKQETAYTPDSAAQSPRRAGTTAKAHGDVPPKARRLHNPMEIAAQHWMQAAMLPWAGWTALGVMMMNWPFMQMRFGALQHADERRHEAGGE